MPYEGYVRKRSKHVPTDSYFYISINLAKCMMRFNFHVVPVITPMTSTQNIPNSKVCSSDKSKPKGINADKSLSYVCSMDESELKTFIVNACSSDESKLKRVHIIVNTNEVKDAMNETKYEEPSFTDNSFINAPIYFNLIECS